MKHFNLYITIILLTIYSCGFSQEKNKDKDMTKHKYTNKLINETSPYLLQHAHNPVNWYPWGEEALNKAKSENKLIIVSIGYSACHWCHVMEKESFENEEVAKFMNDNFISIKIDREERPDIDKIYMDAVQIITQHGGWPLNCIILPDGRPLYGGTYFPKAAWLRMLSEILQFSKDHPGKAEDQAKTITEMIKSNSHLSLSEATSEFQIKDLNYIFEKWKDDIDFINGGAKRAPKFPIPIGYQFLLHYNYLTNNTEALKATTTTLDKMADGGIYDQIEGGFARYSTDMIWKVPHFEKMLYDNAQLVSLYSTAYQATKNEKYKTIVTETLNFIKTKLTSKEGMFYSALDADSEGEEGKSYVWKKSEVDKILGEDAKLIENYYNITEGGNWEHGNNILIKTKTDSKILQDNNISKEELAKIILKSKKALLKVRDKRVQPHLDDKSLTSWNGLMIKAYVDAYRVLDNKEYLEIAIKCAEFMNSNVTSSDNRLNRNYKNGKSSINAFIDDYAFLTSAYIALYQATFDTKWINRAQKLVNYSLKHFYNNKTSLFYYTSNIDPSLIARKTEIMDNVIPCGNSEMAKNLFMLGHYFYNNKYIEISKKMLSSVKKAALQSGVYFANWNILMAWIIRKPYEVAIVGKNFESLRKNIDKYYLPDVFLLGGKDEGDLMLLENKLKINKTFIYVCKDKTCNLPVENIKAAIEEIKSMK